MKSALIAAAAVSVLVMAPACRKQPPGNGSSPATVATPVNPAASALSPEQAAEARRIIVAWLECEECENGELEAVVKLGRTAVPTLEATLRGGPSAANRESLRRHLAATYEELRKQAKTHRDMKVDLDEETYVRTYMDNYVALYHVRSAQALAAIGGAEARRALEQAREMRLREDVAAAVREALQKMAPGG